jgi:hypothetical protein
VSRSTSQAALRLVEAVDGLGWLHYAFCVGFLGLFIGTTIIFFNDEIAEAAGFFGFP